MCRGQLLRLGVDCFFFFFLFSHSGQQDSYKLVFCSSLIFKLCFFSVLRKHAKNSNNNSEGNREWPVMMMYNITRDGCDCSSFESRMTIPNWSASGPTSELPRISHPFDHSSHVQSITERVGILEQFLIQATVVKNGRGLQVSIKRSANKRSAGTSI